MNCKKLLIIEDEKSLANMYKLQFELGGYEVLLAYDGLEGIKKTRIHRPDLVLLDIMMPKMDGLTMLKELRSGRVARNTIVAFLTNLDQPDNIEEGLSYGADHYFTKSAISPRQLMLRINEILNGPTANQLYG